jgi:hypothetical protein
MGAATADRKTVAELRAAKAEREAAEKEKAASDRAAIDDAHKALGTAPGTVPGVDGKMDGHEGSDIHDGDDDAPKSASGAAVQLSFTVGGKKPTTSGVRLVGGKLDIERQFLKGETIVLRIEAVIGEVSFIDQHDAATGQVVGAERRHKARIVAHQLED